jgi:hypothetical protein
MDPVPLTLKQGEVTMYVFFFLGLVTIHHHATFGVDRYISDREKSNVKVLPSGRLARRTDDLAQLRLRCFAFGVQ